MELKTLKQYSELIFQYRDSPDQLAELLIEATSHHAYLSEQIIPLRLYKAEFEIICKEYYMEGGERIKREKNLSDKLVENKWRTHKDANDKKIGEEEYRIKKTIQSLEVIMSNLRAIMFQKSREM